VETPDLSKVSPEVREYIKSQDEKLKLFTSGSTLANFHAGLKKQVDEISVLFITIKMSEKELKSKDDKFFDRYSFFLKNAESIAKGLAAIEKLVTPEQMEEAKIRSDAWLEQYLKDNPEKDE